VWVTQKTIHILARHVIERHGNIDQCMELLAASGGAIHIQHILPYFPEFVTIEHFKVCTKSYNFNLYRLYM
jgi:hypothetical protein